MLEVLRRFVKFVAVSFIGGGIDLFMVWILTGYVFNTYFTDVIIAPLISFECAVVAGFTFCWFLIWNDRVGGGVAEFFRRMGGGSKPHDRCIERTLQVLSFEAIATL